MIGTDGMRMVRRGDQQDGYAAKVSQGTHMGPPQEVAEALASGGLAIGIAGSPRHRHKDPGLANLAGAWINSLGCQHSILPRSGDQPKGTSSY